nr:hypothetical protein [uncultured Desulfobulbus sp.]
MNWSPVGIVIGVRRWIEIFYVGKIELVDGMLSSRDILDKYGIAVKSVKLNLFAPIELERFELILFGETAFS